MLKSTEQIIEAGLRETVFTFSDLKPILGGTPASRYALINKALSKGEWIQLKRGAYILNPKYQIQKLSLFHIASQMEPHSYISLESALSHHGWIPENVTVVSSVIGKGRTKILKTPIEEFNFYFIPTNPYEFLTGVLREQFGKQPFLIATPLRALMDMVYEKKLDWMGLDFLTEGLRIDIEHLTQLDQNSFNNIKQVYRSKRVLKFIVNLEAALYHDESVHYSRKTQRI